jgi:(E)-4-hydroxy-3-methyl-but-2-enyl pyrophosphate reductase
MRIAPQIQLALTGKLLHTDAAMKVLLANSAGFCWGVRRAVERVQALAACGTTRRPIYTDGPLIHNNELMAQLNRQGIRETDDPTQAALSTLVIRAHGISPERRRYLRTIDTTLIDATCPDVGRIQTKIRRKLREGFSIVIFGDREHAEVVGLLGFAEGHGYVVGDVDDVAQLPALDRVCLVSQSTQFPDSYSRIAAAVRARFTDVEVLDTICDATRNRQRELLDLVRQADAIVVVGGAHSANTLRLVEHAGRHRPTFHIQTADQIDAAALRGFACVGLTAGASTPDFVIAAVKARLEAI